MSTDSDTILENLNVCVRAIRWNISEIEKSPRALPKNSHPRVNKFLILQAMRQRRGWPLLRGVTSVPKVEDIYGPNKDYPT